MDLDLQGRTALVFGSSSGLGLASAQALRCEGANVVMFARRADLLKTHADRLGAEHHVGDTRNAQDVEDAIEHALSAHGGLDIVVLNGGGPPPGSATAVDGPAIDAAVELLLRPVVATVSSALPHLRASSQGRIVSISSMSVDEPIPNLALSNALRPGVWGYLKTLAAEVAPEGITVNSVGPGRIATDRMRELFTGEALQEQLDAIPAGRMGEPSDVGDVVCFLASGRASYITGVHLNVDGGLTRAL